MERECKGRQCLVGFLFAVTGVGKRHSTRMIAGFWIFVFVWNIWKEAESRNNCKLFRSKNKMWQNGNRYVYSSFSVFSGKAYCV